MTPQLDPIETFPFPVATSEQQARIRNLAEQIDAQSKRVLAAYDELTLTGRNNVLQKVPGGTQSAGAGDTAPPSIKDRNIHGKGLVAVLKSRHDELDAAVLDAYGWSDLTLGPSTGSGRTDISVRGELVEPRLTEQFILERLVVLNAERRAEEAQGLVRWLRPEFQAPAVAPGRARRQDGEHWLG